jgi:hypothetical protein
MKIRLLRLPTQGGTPCPPELVGAEPDAYQHKIEVSIYDQTGRFSGRRPG